MANRNEEVLNADGSLDGKTLITAEDDAMISADWSVSGSIVPAGEDFPVGYLRRSTTILTNDQLKALPTTAITIIAAPGSGSRIKLTALTLVLDTTSGVYTNIDTDYATLTAQTETSELWMASPLFNDGVEEVAVTSLTTAFTTAQVTVIDLPVPAIAVNDGTNSFALGPNSWVGPSVLAVDTEVDNEAIVVAFDNNSAGDLTDGHVNNSLKVIAYYVVEEL